MNKIIKNKLILITLLFILGSCETKKYTSYKVIETDTSICYIRLFNDTTLPYMKCYYSFGDSLIIDKK